MQSKLLLTFVLAAVAANGAAVKRDATATSTVVAQATAVPSVSSAALEQAAASLPFVNDDGSIDFSALNEATADVEGIAPPDYPVDVDVITPASAVTSQALAQAADQINDAAADSSSDVSKRDTAPAWAGYPSCGTQTYFNAVTADTSSVSAFQNDASLASAANAATTPSGFTKAYSAKTGAFQMPGNVGFIGSKTLSSYTPATCATECAAKKNCQGFNIYFERDPSINLDGKTASYLSTCNNPPAVTTIQCQYFGLPVSDQSLLSTGQVRGNYFRTAKAGSNGYNISPYTPPTLPGFTAPAIYGGKIDNNIVSPPGEDTQIAGVHTINGASGFDAAACGAIAEKYYSGKYQSFLTFDVLRAGLYSFQGCLVYLQKGYTAAQANDAGQWGGITSSGVDERNIWYSFNPTYYYEKSS